MAEDASTSAPAGDVPKGRAKNRGGVQMSPAEKALRDSAIVAALHAGVPSNEVAKDFGITPRSVRRIHEAFRLRPTALDQRPMEIVERVLRLYEQQMRDFAVTAQDTLARAPAVAIAAMKGHADSLERYTMLLSSVGKLPDNLELFRAESEMRQIGTRMFEKIRELERGDISVTEAAEFFRGLTTSSAPLQTYDAPEGSVHELEAGGET